MMYWILLITLTVLSSLIGNLKNIFLIKGSLLSQYITMALDSFIYIVLMKSIITNNDWMSIFLYIIGRTVSVWLTQSIANKVVKETYMVNLYIDDCYIDDLTTNFLENNYSFTVNKGHFINDPRYYFTLHVSNKQFKELQNYLHSENIRASYDVTTVQTYGQINNRVGN